MEQKRKCDVLFLQGIFGTIYTQSTNSTEELASNYYFLLEEKRNLLRKLNSQIYTSSPASKIVLEEWEIDLLQLQEGPVVYNKENSVPYPVYYSLEEQRLLDLLKKAAFKTESISQEDFSTLYDFIRNRGKVESMLEESGNGLTIDINTLEKIMDLTNNRVLTAGKAISLYEKLCQKLGISKKVTEKILEYKI